MAEGPSCTALESALQVFGRAWAGGVLDALLNGATRFSDIRDGVPGATDTMVSRRLKELCDAGFVRRSVDPGPPTAVRYELTDAGRDASPVLEALRTFGARHPAAPTRVE